MTASERDALVGRVYSCVEAGLPARIDDTFSLLYEVERLTRERDAWRRLVRDDGYTAFLTAIDAARTTGGRDA